MKCDAFRDEIVHVLLRQAQAEMVLACDEHARLCATCRAESESIAQTLRGLRQIASVPVSRSFRERVVARASHEAVLDRELLGAASLADRALASGAFLLHRVRQSTALKVLVAVAAAQLLAVVLYFALVPADPAAGGAPLHGSAPPAVGPPIGTAGDPAARPAGEPIASPAADELRARGERIDPADYADAHVIEHPEVVPAEAEADLVTLAQDVGEEIREMAESDNRLAHMRYLMRLRLAARPAVERRDRDPVDRAVLAGMRWLVEQQQADGSWDPGAFGGDTLARVGVTGLVLAALSVDAGFGMPDGVQRQTIARGLHFLRGALDPGTGTYGRVVATADREALTLFNHAMATLAFAENYVLHHRADQDLLGDALLRLDDLAVQRMHRQLEPVDGTTAPWVALALETAQASGIRCGFDLTRATADARRYVVRDLPAVDGPLYNERMWQAVTASAIDPLFDGERDPRLLRPSVDRVLAHLRTPDLREPTKIYFAALDLYLRGGIDWQHWREQAAEVLLDSQAGDGSWESEYTWDRVSAAGGALYSTALTVMTLSVPYRHAR